MTRGWQWDILLGLLQVENDLYWNDPLDFENSWFGVKMGTSC